MKNQFVPYKLALCLRELGFSEECLGEYEIMPDGSDSSTVVVVLKTFIVDNNEWRLCSAPLWQQAFDWFREKHGITSWISKSFQCFNINIVKSINEDENENISGGISFKDFKSYEEARFACLEKLIELVSEK